MTVNTITRAFSDPSNLIQKAKQKTSPFIYGIKKFFYNLSTLGFGKAMDKAREERREKEVVTASFDILHGLPEEYTALDQPNNKDKVLHTNKDNGYQIKLTENKLVLFQGNVSQSPITGENMFIPDDGKSHVLADFSTEEQFNEFKQNLGLIKSTDYYKVLALRHSLSNLTKSTTTIASVIQQAREDEIEQEIIPVTFNLLKALPKNHDQLTIKENQNKVLYTSLGKKYQIVLEGKELCLYTGNVAKSFYYKEKYFDVDKTSRQVLGKFDSSEQFNQFKDKLKIISTRRKHEAASLIQRKFRMFNKKLKAIEANKFGIRYVVVENAQSKKTYAFSENLEGHAFPENNIESGQEGGFKIVRKKQYDNLLFEEKETSPALFTTGEISKILIVNKITTWVGSTRIGEKLLLAHNAGDKNLYEEIRRNKKIFAPRFFSNLLKDTKKLHQVGYYHLDIKPENIQIHPNKGPCLVDLDSFSSTNKIVRTFTPAFTHQELYKINYPSNATNLSLQIADEFAFALTIMEACGIRISKTTENVRIGDMYITPEMEEFITINIKPEYQSRFKELITNPFTYWKRYANSQTVYLADMFNF